MSSYIINNNKNNFTELCFNLKNEFPYRKETIEKKQEYIMNNWKNIQNLYNYNLSCPMESQISHNLAYLLTSRPKGYSIKMLDKIIKIRLLYKNNEDIKKLFLNNYNLSTQIEIKEELNFDIYDRHKTFTPEYKDMLYNPDGFQYYITH